MNTETIISFLLGFSLGVIVLRLFIYKKQQALQGMDLTEIMAQLPSHVYWKNKEGVYLGCNTAHWENFGLQSLSACVGKTDYDIFPKEEADQLRQVDREVMRTGQSIIVKEDGKTGLYLSHKVPLRDTSNQVIGILGTSINVTGLYAEKH